MKEKWNLFIHRFINPITIIIYLILLYCLYTYKDYKINKTMYDWLTFLIIVGILSFVLIIWLVISLTNAIQENQIQLKFFQIPHIVKIGCIIGIVGSILCFQGIMNLKDNYTTQFQKSNYSIDFNLQNQSSYNEWVHKLKDCIDEEVKTKEILYVSFFELKCNSLSTIESIQMRVYYENQGIRHNYNFYYKDNQLHITSNQTKNEGYFDQTATLQDLLTCLETESLLSKDCELSIVYKIDSSRLQYKIGKQAYLEVSDNNEIEQGQSNESVNKIEQNQPKELPISEDTNRGEVTSQSILDSGAGYRLRETDAAAGLRFYGLDKTTDGGKTWKAWNKDPFHQAIGTGSELIFIDEKIGFMNLIHGGGDRSEMFYTHDGGKTTKKMNIKNNGDYDYFHLPYIKDGKYYLKVTEGIGTIDEIIYISSDKGKTWKKQ
ncbi:MAG: WD40/YVTN/BNR-like repeat-containing protein [Longibaculum sp.]